MTFGEHQVAQTLGLPFMESLLLADESCFDIFFLQGGPGSTYGCRSSSFVGLRTAPHYNEHQLRMRRPQKIKCHLGFAKQSQASKAIKWACERLGVEVQTSTTSEANLNSWTASNREGNPPHIMILDCRAKKSLDLETIAK